MIYSDKLVINTHRRKIMNILVTYHSETGNTKKIAHAIYESIKEPKDLLTFDEVSDVDKYDLIFVGFPIHEFGPSKNAVKIFKERIANKKVALFVTHAMLEEAPLSNIQISNCKKIAKENNLLGVYSCRGVLSESVAMHMINSKDEKMINFGKMRGQTIGHPDENDINNAITFTKNLLELLN